MNSRLNPNQSQKIGAGRLPASAHGRALVVATVHSPAGLRLATRCKPGEVDVLELRLDALEGRLPAIRETLPTLRLPVLVTARHPAEGGCGGLTLRRRKQLLTEFLPAAAFVDVELRSVVAMRDVILAAKAQGVVVVVSDHHFRGTPPLARLLARQRMAFAAGADAFKLATLADDAKSLARLLDLAAAPAAGPRAIMGMGKLGKVSRLTLAVAGSVLNYGYLDQPNAPGQWEAKELRDLLNRITL